MSAEVVVAAAGFLTPSGYGSSEGGRRPWVDAEVRTIARRELMEISWSSMFRSPSARFGRMSPLARIGLMSVELLGPALERLTEEQRTETGICMLSAFGSIATDIEFLQDNSPATFTYTLPSSVIGEACIRHRLRGPCLCLMSPGTGGRGIVEEAADRIASGEAPAMICIRCEAPGAGSVLHNALDREGDFCWYSYALYLARRDVAPEAKRVVGVTGETDIRRACLELCGGLPEPGDVSWRLTN